MKKLLLNPFFVFWSYYFIGPFLTLPQIIFIINSESIIDEDMLLTKLIYHTLAYLTCLPFVLYISLYLKINNDNKLAPYLLKGSKSFMIILIWGFVLYLFYFLWSNILIVIGPDYPRAVAYIDFLEENHIITLIILILIMIFSFLDTKYASLLGVFVIIFDALMSRRNLMIFFFYQFMRRLTYKKLIYIFIFFFAFSVLRHRDNLTLNLTNLYAPVFSEAYMIFLSSVQYSGCPIEIGSFLNYFTFERTFQACRTLNSGGGGFSSRFNYDIIFGLFSVGIFTILNTTVLFFFSKYIYRRLQTLLASILFVTLFIIFRDSLWNAQLFFLKYFFLLLTVSILISALKKFKLYRETYNIGR